MTVMLIEACDMSFSEPQNATRFFSGKRARLEELQKREEIPIGKPGLSCQNNLFLGFFFDGTRNNYALSTDLIRNLPQRGSTHELVTH